LNSSLNSNVSLTSYAIVLTLAASGLAALCLSLVLTPVAFYLSMRPNAVLEALVDVPASVPHPVMGIGILLLFSEYTPIGQLARSLGSSTSLSNSWATSSITLLEAKITVGPFVPVVEYLRTIHDFRIE